MSASQGQRAEWLDAAFWDRLERLAGRWQRSQSEYDGARRAPEGLAPGEAEELRRAWQRYSEVIAELDAASAEPAAPRRT